MAGLEEAQPKRGFGPAPEVMSYFEGKQLAPRFSWLDIWGEEHASAFTVAKATELELLTAFRDSIRNALANGQGLETWKAGIEPELRRLGWWGKRTVVDPTGQDKPRTVDFSAPRRLKNIFWSNMNAARSAGQWERIQRTKRALPYLLYVRTTAAEPRQEHLSWVGTILPADDPFWATHFPPNGWGCKCTVRQITRRERERLLASSATPIRYSAERPAIRTTRFINRRTGAVTEVPDGIDPGWHTNAGIGRANALIDTLRSKIEYLGDTGADGVPLARKAINDFWASDTPLSFSMKQVEAPMPVAILPELSRALNARSSVIVVSPRTVTRTIHRAAGVDIDQFAMVQMILDRGTAVASGGEGQDITFWLPEENSGDFWAVAIRVGEDGVVRLASLFRSSRDEFRDVAERFGLWHWRG